MWQRLPLDGVIDLDPRSEVALGRCGDVLARQARGSVQLWRASDGRVLLLPPMEDWRFASDGRWLVARQADVVVGVHSIQDDRFESFDGPGVAGVTEEVGLELTHPLSLGVQRGVCLDGMLSLVPIDQPWPNRDTGRAISVESCLEPNLWKVPRIELDRRTTGAEVRVHDYGRQRIGPPVALEGISGPGAATLQATARAALLMIEPGEQPCLGPVQVVLFDLQRSLQKPVMSTAFPVGCGSIRAFPFGWHGVDLAVVSNEHRTLWYTSTGRVHMMDGLLLHLSRSGDAIVLGDGGVLFAMDPEGETRRLALGAGPTRASPRGSAIGLIDRGPDGLRFLTWPGGKAETVEVGACPGCAEDEVIDLLWVADDGQAMITFGGPHPPALVRHERGGRPAVLRPGILSAQGVNLAEGRAVLLLQSERSMELVRVDDIGQLDTLATGEVVSLIHDAERRYVAAVVRAGGAIESIWSGR